MAQFTEADTCRKYVLPKLYAAGWDDDRIPEYMSAIVTTPWFYEKLADLTRGVGARRERTRPEAFLELEIPMPTVEQQRDARRVLNKLDILKPLQSETCLEIDALMPSILSKTFGQ